MGLRTNFFLDSKFFPLITTKLEKEALTSLQQLLQKPQATWSNAEQRLGVLGALDGSSDMVLISRTGSGKTMVGIIPALINKHCITVVVIPLVSLLQDYERRLVNLNIPYQRYTGGDTDTINSSSSLILVSADHAIRQPFRTAIKVAHSSSRRVTCFIYDEGHLVVTDSGYRNALRDAQEIRCVPVPLIVLTGTAPPSCLPVMAERFGLVTPYLIIRGVTDRPELQFLLEPKRELAEIPARVQALVLESLTRCRAQDRIMVFVTQINFGQTIADRLQCELYSGNKDHTSDRDGVYNRWIAGSNKVIVGTSALFAGNDYPHVRYVIFAGTPTDMTGTFQGLARGGRDGETAYGYILPNKGARSLLAYDEIDHAGCTKIHELCNNLPAICIRYQFTQWCDGAGVTCADSSGGSLLPCTSCQKLAQTDLPPWYQAPVSQVIPPEMRVQIIGGQVAAAAVAVGSSNFKHAVDQANIYRDHRFKTIEPLVHIFDRGFYLFHNQCTLCQLGVGTHNLVVCPKNSMGQVAQFRKALGRYTTTKKDKSMWGSICYHCHLPQLPGDRVHGEFSKNRSACAHPDFMVGLGVRIESDNQLMVRATKELGFSRDKFYTWLIQRPMPTKDDPMLGRFVSNFVRLVCWYLVDIAKIE